MLYKIIKTDGNKNASNCASGKKRKNSQIFSKKVLTKRVISDIIQKLSARAGSEPILEN